MLPSGVVTHEIPGRLRIRILSRQRDRAYFSRLEEKFKQCEGVDALQANPLTGGILLMHRTDLPTISRYAEQNELFIVTHPVPSAPVSQEVAGRFRSLDRRLQSLSAGKIDLSAAAFVGLTLAGLFQLLRQNVWPAGVTLLWYAVSVLPKKNDRIP